MSAQIIRRLERFSLLQWAAGVHLVHSTFAVLTAGLVAVATKPEAYSPVLANRTSQTSALGPTIDAATTFIIYVCHIFLLAACLQIIFKAPAHVQARSAPAISFAKSVAAPTPAKATQETSK